LLRTLVDVFVGEADRLVAGGFEYAVLTGVVVAVAWAAVVGAVDFDGGRGRRRRRGGRGGVAADLLY
jgi:hypothetical protein